MHVRKTFQHIGVGYYPNSNFVHVDVRDGPSAFWIDYSGPGQDAMYSENAALDLRTGRADTWKPKKIDPAWAVEPMVDDGEPGDKAGGPASAPVAGPTADLAAPRTGTENSPR